MQVLQPFSNNWSCPHGARFALNVETQSLCRKVTGLVRFRERLNDWAADVKHNLFSAHGHIFVLCLGRSNMLRRLLTRWRDRFQNPKAIIAPWRLGKLPATLDFTTNAFFLAAILSVKLPETCESLTYLRHTFEWFINFFYEDQLREFHAMQTTKAAKFCQKLF